MQEPDRGSEAPAQPGARPKTTKPAPDGPRPKAANPPASAGKGTAGKAEPAGASGRPGHRVSRSRIGENTVADEPTRRHRAGSGTGPGSVDSRSATRGSGTSTPVSNAETRAASRRSAEGSRSITLPPSLATMPSTRSAGDDAGPGPGSKAPSERTGRPHAGPPPTKFTLARALAGLGRSLIAAGVIILLFAAYQLWGTGIHEQQAQDDLESTFNDVLAAAGQLDMSSLLTTTTVTAPAPTAAPTTPPTVPPELTELLYPEEGRPVGLIQIPRIGVNKIVVEGTAIEDLKNGPGHFNNTPLPGQGGNASIAGHRTTYGAPFGDIDQLEPGDEIKVTTILGEAVYKVAGQQIVDPSQVEVVGDFGDNRLTLTACHPKFSAAKRIVVWATLQGDPFPTVPRPTDTRTVELPGDPAATTLPPETTAATPVAEATTTVAPTTVPMTTEAPATTVASLDSGDGEGLSGDPDAWPPTLAWGALCTAIALAAWFIGKQWERRSGRSWARRYTVYLAASPLFLACLYSCFVHVDRLLPAY